MKCPICEQNMKKFKFDNPKELLFQCKECNFNVNIQKNQMIISLNDRLNISEFTSSQSDRTWKFYYSEEKYDRKKELKQWNDIECIINNYRVKNKKKKIRYFHPLKQKCNICKKIKLIKMFYFDKRTKNRYECKRCSKKNHVKSYYKYNNLIKRKYHEIHRRQKQVFKKELSFNLFEFKKWIKENNFKYFYDILIKNIDDKKYKICIFRKNRNIDFNLNNFGIMFQSDYTKMQKIKKNTVKVVQMINGKIIQIWPSIISAANSEKKFDQGQICKVCRGKQKSHAGYQWKYLKDL